MDNQGPYQADAAEQINGLGLYEFDPKKTKK